MSIQQENGLIGEQLANKCLLEAGMEILEKNWRYKNAEIDIIAMDQGALVFIEVKMRSYSEFGRPEQMVGKRKKRLLIDAAMAYMRSIGHEWEIRFDIVAILGSPGRDPVVKLYKDAFFPGLGYKG